MFHYYKIAVTVGALVIPCTVLAWRNNFDGRKKMARRFSFAVVAVWAYLIASRFVVDAVDLSLANTQEEIQAIYDGDGAKNVFALFFGWIPGFILASAAWLLTRGYRWLKWRAMGQPNA